MQRKKHKDTAQMSITVSQQTYHERIHQVIDYISEHLADEIILDDLASIACFSPFHFHRIFTSIIGETPHDFIERMRLETAANKLCTTPNKSVSEIAFECGYSSISSFSRSFKKHHKLPPIKFLKAHIHDFHSIDTPEALLQTKDVDITSVEMVSVPKLHLAYVQTVIGYANGIPKAWDKLMQYAQKNNLISSQTLYIGVPYDNPGITPRLKCRYRACITVPESLILTKGEVKTFDFSASACCAKYHFQGGIGDISKAYALVYGQWLPKSGYVPDGKPSIEIYPPELHREGCCNKMEYDIILPVIPL